MITEKAGFDFLELLKRFELFVLNTPLGAPAAEGQGGGHLEGSLAGLQGMVPGRIKCSRATAHPQS